MVIKKKTALKAVLVFALLAAGFWGFQVRVKNTQSGKVPGSLEGQRESGTGSVAGEATGASEIAKSNILTEEDGKSPAPSALPNFVPAFATNADANSNMFCFTCSGSLSPNNSNASLSSLLLSDSRVPESGGSLSCVVTGGGRI